MSYLCLDNLRPHLQVMRSISVGEAPTIPDTDGVNEMLAEAPFTEFKPHSDLIQRIHEISNSSLSSVEW